MATRKLEAQGSNPEAPAKKALKGLEGEASSAEQQEDDIGENDVKGMFKLLMQEMRSMKGEMVGMKGMAEQACTIAAEARQTASAAKQAITRVDANMEDCRKDVRKVQEQVAKLEFDLEKVKLEGKPNDTIDDKEAELRDLQVIAGGFDRDTDADSIIAQIRNFLAVDSRDSKVTKVTTFTDPCSFGVIEFASVPAKYGFYKKIKDADKSLPNGKHMWFSNNKTFEERFRDKVLGKIKFELVERGMQREAVKINWKAGSIEIKGEIVAEVSKQGFPAYRPQAEHVQKAVEEHMAQWKSKNGVRKGPAGPANQ
jgi:hypothetical protein